jgi:hypothetical protein
MGGIVPRRRGLDHMSARPVKIGLVRHDLDLPGPRTVKVVLGQHTAPAGCANTSNPVPCRAGLSRRERVVRVEQSC